MPTYPVRSIVLRKTKLGETDIIVTLIASDGHQIRAVAKGMRKPGSRFGGRLEPFAEVDLLVHQGRSLDVVTEVESVEPHAALREDFDRSVAASVVADVTDKLSADSHAEERLFGLARATLAAMGGCDTAALPRLVCGFLVKAMALHGVRPELDACAACAAEADGGSSFSMGAGGVLCPSCGERDPAALPFTETGRALLGSLLGMTMEEIAGADIPTAHVREAFGLLRGFVAYHIPARLKALDFYAGVTI